ncbi:protein embryo defective 514, partial [Quercus suber]
NSHFDPNNTHDDFLEPSCSWPDLNPKTPWDLKPRGLFDETPPSNPDNNVPYQFDHDSSTLASKLCNHQISTLPPRTWTSTHPLIIPREKEEEKEKEEPQNQDNNNGDGVVLSKKQKVEEEEKSSEEERLEKLVGGGGEEQEQEKEEEEEKSGQTSLGPKDFGSSVEMFDYFYKFLHFWPPNLNVNKVEREILGSNPSLSRSNATRYLG